MPMKKIFTMFLAIAGALSLSAKTFYLKPNDNWKQADAKFSIYYFNNESDNGWTAFMTSVDATTYSADVPDNYGNIIFVRHNPQAAAPGWEKDNKWNQTNDLAVPTDGSDCYTIAEGAWDNGDGSWSTYSQGGTPGGGDPNPGGGGSTLEGNPRYYWKGFVDDQPIEPTDATLFVNGEADIAFSSAAYIFVLYQVDNYDGVQYMAPQYYDDTNTHAPLTIDGVNAQGEKIYEKWKVPAGTTKLYLYDNGDGSLEISSQPMPGKQPAIPGGAQQTDALENIQFSEDMPMYNILGLPVSDDYEGIVIQGGRKFMRIKR